MRGDYTKILRGACVYEIRGVRALVSPTNCVAASELRAQSGRQDGGVERRDERDGLLCVRADLHLRIPWLEAWLVQES